VHSEPEPLRKLDPQIPEELERLVTHALNKNRGHRLQSAAEFAAGLNGIAQNLRDIRTAAEPMTAAAAVQVAPPGVPQAPAIVPAPKPPIVVPAIQPPPAPAIVTPVPAPVLAPIAALPQPTAAPALAAIKMAMQGHMKAPVPLQAILRKRMIPIAIAGVLAIAVFGTLLSRQSSQASQRQSDSTAVQQNPTAPAAPISAAPVPVPVQPPEAAPSQPAPQASAVSPVVVEVQPAPEVILRGQVKSLWETGRYAQALKLVDAILAENPTHPEARAWKKKIRAAQDAEAAIK